MNQQKRIFAIVGMAGAGKGEVVRYLEDKYRWPKLYVPQPLFDELKKKDMQLNWENEKKLRENMRKKHGQNFFAKLAMPEITERLKKSNVVLLESLYGWGECQMIKKAYPDYFRLIGVWAPPAVRFERIRNRTYRPIKTFKEFEERDRNEIEITEKGGPIAIADYMVVNDGSVNELHRSLDRIMIKEGIMEQPMQEDRG